jgi:hypothetical protein
MKFSVLLPTRNRLEYLRYAVETVRRQDYGNWEIVVSDNCSEDDIAGYVNSLGDGRIRYVRTERFVPVTDNWNNALRHSSGDYVVMLGDDDGLLPDYFSTLLRTFESFDSPDFVYLSALFFAYPGVMPDTPKGFLRRDHNRMFPEQAPFWLSADRAKAITRGYLDFRMPVASNMQFSLISRRMIERMSSSGPFFQSPYPDFFATPALFLQSARILILPRPMVVIGITPKSYGFFHFNDRAADGVKFLKNDERQPQAAACEPLMLPGTSYNDSWLLAMEALSTNYSAAQGMHPNYARYRLLQIVHTYKKVYFDRVLGAKDLAALRSKMSLVEKAVYGVAFPVGFSVLRLAPTGLRAGLISRLRRLIGQHAIRNTDTSPAFDNLLDVFESMRSRPAAS